ncbi:E3 SUMO-protein ligase ZBED1 [Frankliniella fusca]|uniref:E3 SUMO-protein ligase ZBED1 n=1 Tax=Frankliniella fusca TaxID=407009 RepID=A0AAE1L9D0_9NEOP|nr:E3 SUMO-protein ligase ZBED1 [Frankliniella fusca]
MYTFELTEWTLVETTLACQMISEDHVGVHLKEVFLQMLADWDISLQSKVSAVTSDNGDNIRLALELIEDTPNHITCFGHTINNGVTAVVGVGKCQGLKSSTLKAHSARSWLCGEKVWRAYEKYVHDKAKKPPKMTPSPCKTRWWVDLHIAEAVVHQYKWMWGFASSYWKYFSEIPSREDVSILKAYIKALKPIEKLSTLLCAERYVTSSLILPMTHILDPDSSFYGGEDLVLTESTNIQWEQEENEEIGDVTDDEDEDDIPLSDYAALQPKSIHAQIAEKLNKRYNPPLPADDDDGVRARVEFERAGACNSVLQCCSYLDPGFRSEVLEADRVSAKERLLGEILSFTETGTEGPSSSHSHSAIPTENNSTVASAASARRTVQQEQIGPQVAADPQEKTKKDFNKEIAIYEGLPDAELTDNVFAWWQRHCGSLPLLATLARKYLAIPASSVPSERLFSTGGNVVTDTRRSLTGQHAEMLIFCASNSSHSPRPSNIILLSNYALILEAGTARTTSSVPNPTRRPLKRAPKDLKALGNTIKNLKCWTRQKNDQELFGGIPVYFNQARLLFFSKLYRDPMALYRALLEQLLTEEVVTNPGLSFVEAHSGTKMDPHIHTSRRITNWLWTKSHPKKDKENPDIDGPTETVAGAPGDTSIPTSPASVHHESQTAGVSAADQRLTSTRPEHDGGQTVATGLACLAGLWHWSAAGLVHDLSRYSCPLALSFSKIPPHDRFYVQFSARVPIQTKRQAELMAQHCHKIVLLDETHGTNHHKYQLLTAMVIYDNRRGWPVAHLVTSKSDDETLQYFFSTLKAKLPPDAKVNCVITDDAPSLINGMGMGICEELVHILCK